MINKFVLLFNIKMKITIKTMQGKASEYEMDETNTLEDLKKKVAEDQKLDASSLKLIHYGKVLSDNTKKLCDLGIKPKDFLVLMPTKVV